MGRRKSLDERREQKRQALIERTAMIMDSSQEEATRRLSIPLVQSVRLNPLKGNVEDTLTNMKVLGWNGLQHQWCEDGYTIDQGYEALRDSDLVPDGKIYIQNPSSWLPVAALDAQVGERVLDVCAAPGGKTSHIAARQGNSGELTVNDNSRARLAKLQANLARLGVEAEYALHDATRLTKYMEPESFDKILLDAPCSGEGLINLEQPKSLDSWSVAHVRRLSDLQKKIITQAWQLLAPGGRLVYSTCTMAPEENEAVIDYLLRRYDDAALETLPFTLAAPLRSWNGRDFNPEVIKSGRVFPEDGSEAFFVCSLRKGTTSVDS